MISFKSNTSILLLLSIVGAATAADETTIASTTHFDSVERELRGSADYESMPTSSKTSKSKASKQSSKSSKSYSMSYGGCTSSTCVNPSIPRFEITSSADIGDTLNNPQPGLTKRCGCDCYTVKDAGDDPPHDPEEFGDTQRFAYRKVTSTDFTIKARTCGVKCYGEEEEFLIFGRVGLQVRQSLHPLDKSIFISHKPQAQAEYSWRKEYNGEFFLDFSGSPDVDCLWITLTRDGNVFKSTYAYDPMMEGEVCESDFDIGLDQEVEIDMTDTVYVGLAVSSEVYDGSGTSCKYTEADFESIEFVCEGKRC